MVAVSKAGPAVSSLAHSLLGITLGRLAWAAQCYACPRRVSLTILSTSALHLPLAEVIGVPFLVPGDFWIWLRNSSNGVQEKRQVSS